MACDFPLLWVGQIQGCKARASLQLSLSEPPSCLSRRSLFPESPIDGSVSHTETVLLAHSLYEMGRRVLLKNWFHKAHPYKKYLFKVINKNHIRKSALVSFSCRVKGFSTVCISLRQTSPNIVTAYILEFMIYLCP